MFCDGYRNIFNIDSSYIVAQQMASHYKAKAIEMTYIHMDARAMAYEDASFDAVIDKGTLDSILSGDNSTAGALAMFREIQRVLTPNGVYICVTYGKQD